tara:strand:+ start:24033 stop:24308 length:276 start_codon:yes stop_codon:yes gene_type:complete
LLYKTFEPAFADEKRPSLTHFRGIYFAEDETQPRLVWLRIIRVTGDYHVYLSGFKDATSFSFTTTSPLAQHISKLVGLRQTFIRKWKLGCG